MRTIIATFFLAHILTSLCGQTITDIKNYPNDSLLSTINGTPKDSTTFYFPNTIQVDSQNFKTEIDTILLSWFSGDLYAANEPILFNYYLGQDMYRFLWLRSFQRPVVFTIKKSENQITLTTKILDREAQEDNLAYDPREWQGKENIPEKHLKDGLKKKKYRIERYGDTLVIIKHAKTASLVYNKTKKLSKDEWDQFESILNECSFWTSKPCVNGLGLDGSEWIIEGHFKHKYWFMQRWSPTDKFKKAGEYLINKSRIKEEIY
jgi:hypothetical protein